jgi:class 3 adenylate cyclase
VADPALGTDYWGLRFTDRSVEQAYAAWRLFHVRPFTIAAMYAGGLASTVAWFAVLFGALTDFRTIALWLIPVSIAMHGIGAWIAAHRRFLRWMLPFSAVNNCFGGMLALTMTISLDNFAITAGCITMAAYFGLTMFRMQPWLALVSVGSYVLVAEIVAVILFDRGDMVLNELIIGLFIPITTLLTGFVLTLGIERGTRRTYADHRVIEAQRQALFYEHSNMARFLSHEITDQINARGLEAALRPEMLPITVICTDLRGFTSFTDAHGAEAMASVLRAYYEAIIETTAVFGGTVKDFAGDGALVLVGAPLPKPDHARTGVELARGLLAAITKVTREFGTPETPLGIGIGVASGECAVGAIGSATRLEYTAVGSAVNLAARLCTVAQDGQLVMAPSTARLVDPAASWRTTAVTVKGFSRPVEAIVEETRVAVIGKSEVPLPAD